MPNMTFMLIFFHVGGCWLGHHPPLHLIKEMRQKTKYVMMSVYNRVLNSN